MQSIQRLLITFTLVLAGTGCASSREFRVEVPDAPESALPFRGHASVPSPAKIKIIERRGIRGFELDSVGRLHAKPGSPHVVIGQIRVEAREYPDFANMDREDREELRARMLHNLRRKAHRLGASHVIYTQVRVQTRYEELPRATGYAVILKNKRG